ncbi:hypothetical protein SCA6_004761 [Theobroma cacao]
MCAQLNVLQIELEVSHAGFLNESPQISKDHCSDESSHCIRDGVREVPQKVYAECVESDQAVKKEESNAVLNSNAQKAPNKHMEDSWKSSLILATIIGEGPPQLSVDENQRMLGDMQHSLPNSESLLSTRPPTILRGKQQL